MVSKDTLCKDLTGFSPGLKCLGREEDIEDGFGT